MIGRLVVTDTGVHRCLCGSAMTVKKLCVSALSNNWNSSLARKSLTYTEKGRTEITVNSVLSLSCYVYLRMSFRNTSLDPLPCTTYLRHRKIIGKKVGNSMITMGWSYVGALGNGPLSYDTGISRHYYCIFLWLKESQNFLVISYGGEFLCYSYDIPK